MTDLMDVLDASGIPTGEVLPRAEVHRLGQFHRAVHLYLLNAEGELLLQRRSQTASEPGVLSVSVTGHVEAGESSAACVQREVEEELGIFAGSLDTRLLFSFFQEGLLEGGRLDRQFIDVYSARTDIDPSSLRLDPAEVSEVLLVPFAEFRRMALEGSGGLAPVYARESDDAAYFLERMGCVVAQAPAPSLKLLQEKDRYGQGFLEFIDKRLYERRIHSWRLQRLSHAGFLEGPRKPEQRAPVLGK